MRVSHEAIYQALYVQGRGALKRELVACLRTGRALRVPRARARRTTWAHVTPEVMISERAPPRSEDRAVPGHWEGDLLIGLERSAIGTLVERTTRCHDADPPAPSRGLRHRPTLQERGPAPSPAKETLAAQACTHPAVAPGSPTNCVGIGLGHHGEMPMSAHADRVRKVETGVSVYFADPHSLWQAVTNESVERPASSIFPKGNGSFTMERRGN